MWIEGFLASYTPACRGDCHKGRPGKGCCEEWQGSSHNQFDTHKQGPGSCKGSSCSDRASSRAARANRVCQKPAQEGCAGPEGHAGTHDGVSGAGEVHGLCGAAWLRRTPGTALPGPCGGTGDWGLASLAPHCSSVLSIVALSTGTGNVAPFLGFARRGTVLLCLLCC